MGQNKTAAKKRFPSLDAGLRDRLIQEFGKDYTRAAAATRLSTRTIQRIMEDNSGLRAGTRAKVLALYLTPRLPAPEDKALVAPVGPEAVLPGIAALESKALDVAVGVELLSKEYARLMKRELELSSRVFELEQRIARLEKKAPREAQLPLDWQPSLGTYDVTADATVGMRRG